MNGFEGKFEPLSASDPAFRLVFHTAENFRLSGQPFIISLNIGGEIGQADRYPDQFSRAEVKSGESIS